MVLSKAVVGSCDVGEALVGLLVGSPGVTNGPMLTAVTSVGGKVWAPGDAV